MKVIVMETMIAHIKALKECHPVVIQHDHWQELQQKSEIHTMDMLFIDPSTNTANIQVLEELEKYVPYPNGPDNAPVTMLVHGDGYTMARITEALCLRKYAVDRRERLEGLIPVPGEFHKRMVTQDDTFKLLFHDTEVGSRIRGTLANFKSVLRKKDAKIPVKDHFNGTEDLLHCTAEGLICKTALRLLNINGLDEAIRTEDIQVTFEEVAEKVTSFYWHQLDVSAVCGVLDADVKGDPTKWCSCQQRYDESE